MENITWSYAWMFKYIFSSYSKMAVGVCQEPKLSMRLNNFPLRPKHTFKQSTKIPLFWDGDCDIACDLVIIKTIIMNLHLP